MALVNYLTRIQFDFGALAELPGELAFLAVTRPLIVTDPGVRDAGLLGQLQVHAPAGAPVFDQTEANPTEGGVEAALALYREHGCDGLLALGGGSAIDTAKAVALLATHPGRLGDYNVQTGGSERVGELAPVIAIPTTAGAGAEVGRAIVMTLADGSKCDVVNLKCVPKSVICDPELTLSLPPSLTAATGMDALTHGIETYVSNRPNPVAEGLALDCVRRISGHIRRAAADGRDREARWHMMAGALEGGMVLQKGLGAVHALSGPLGELKLHHGTLNAVLLPTVLRFNAEAAAGKFDDIKRAIGLRAQDDLAEWAARLNADLGMPRTLSEMGVGRDVVADMAAKAARTHLSATNPRPATAQDYEGLLEAAL
ncbi:MAG: iron-containing alcohol dehydrogenase [Caulobacterales bacterium]|nr:iron-containing alcohol dehydrogenase [Caulobacterales bacterium]